MSNIKIEISARHGHLSQEHVDALFGKDYQLTVRNYISQLKQFAAQETITIQTEKGSIENFRIVGPVRDKTQLEISASDARILDIHPPIRLSGDISGSCGCTLVGPVGSVEILEGVIIADRHIHCDPDTATKLGLIDKQHVSVKTGGVRPVTFHNVNVRINENFEPRFHIDTDESNAAFPDGEIGEGEILL